MRADCREPSDCSSGIGFRTASATNGTTKTRKNENAKYTTYAVMAARCDRCSRIHFTTSRAVLRFRRQVNHDSGATSIPGTIRPSREPNSHPDACHADALPAATATTALGTSHAHVGDTTPRKRLLISRGAPNLARTKRSNRRQSPRGSAFRKSVDGRSFVAIEWQWHPMNLRRSSNAVRLGQARDSRLSSPETGHATGHGEFSRTTSANCPSVSPWLQILSISGSPISITNCSSISMIASTSARSYQPPHRRISTGSSGRKLSAVQPMEFLIIAESSGRLDRGVGRNPKVRKESPPVA